MQVTAWTNGSGIYGIRVGSANRNRFFQPIWEEIEVDIADVIHEFRLTRGFWKDCPEFRDSRDIPIETWLLQQRVLPWPPGVPPKFVLLPRGDAQFKLDIWR